MKIVRSYKEQSLKLETKTLQNCFQELGGAIQSTQLNVLSLFGMMIESIMAA